MQQVIDIEDIFRAYFKVAVLPDRIIELGTMTGRFSRIVYRLRAEYNNDFDYITVDQRRDIKEEYMPMAGLPNNMIYMQMNIWPNMKLIERMLKPKTLVLCDNGNKIEEVKALYFYLPQDCVIMAHDYFYDQAAFKAQSAWTTRAEITWADVEHLGLKPYNQEIMDRGHWLAMSNIGLYQK
jgi:hypothetical protein